MKTTTADRTVVAARRSALFLAVLASFLAGSFSTTAAAATTSSAGKELPSGFAAATRHFDGSRNNLTRYYTLTPVLTRTRVKNETNSTGKRGRGSAGLGRTVGGQYRLYSVAVAEDGRDSSAGDVDGGDKDVEDDYYLTLHEGCAAEFRPADSEESILQTISVRSCVSDCRGKGYHHAAVGRCFSPACQQGGGQQDGDGFWKCGCNYDGISVYAEDGSKCDGTCPFDPSGLPCGGSRADYRSVYATSEDFLLGGTTAEREESAKTEGLLSDVAPVIECPSPNFDPLLPQTLNSNYAPLPGSRSDVSQCCTWSDREHGIRTYAACSLSQTFWQDWENNYAESEVPNFFSRANEICASVLGGSSDSGSAKATLFYAFPDQITDKTYESAAAKVKELMVAQQAAAGGSLLGSLLTAGSVDEEYFEANDDGTPYEVRWSLVDDLTILPEVPEVCKKTNHAENMGEYDQSVGYNCRWDRDYGGTGAESLFDFELGNAGVLSRMPLAFTGFDDSSQVEPWKLHLIGASDPDEDGVHKWAWDPFTKPNYILCQLPSGPDQSTTEQGSTPATSDSSPTSEWTSVDSTAVTSSGWTSVDSTAVTSSANQTPTETESTPVSSESTPVTTEFTRLSSTDLATSTIANETSSSTFQVTTEKEDRWCCQTPEDSIAFGEGDQNFCNILKTRCPEGWWGTFELLQCKKGETLVWKKRCYRYPDMDYLLDVDATPVENLQTLSEIIQARDGNVTADNLEAIVDGLAPITEQLLQVLENITNPDEAFQLTHNYAQEFLNMLDGLLDLEHAWHDYDPEKANGTAANTQLLMDLEKAGEILANQEIPGGEHSVQSQNTFMEVTRRTAKEVQGQGNHSFYFPDENSDTFIRIPPGYHVMLLQNGKDGYSDETSTEDVKTIGLLLKKSEDAIFPGRRNTAGKDASKKKVNTNIMGFKFMVGDKTVPMQFDPGAEGVTLTMKHGFRAMQPYYETIMRDLHAGEKPTAIPDTALCTFLDPQSKSGTWSKQGCRLRQTAEQTTVCECFHLTNFAVLMDVHGYVGKNLGLEVMGYVIGGLSVICLVINFLVFQFIRGARTPTAVLTKHLSGTLLLGHLIMSVAFDKTYFAISDLTCSLVAASVHFLFLSAFCWMLLEGYILYVRLVHIFQQEKETPHWKNLCVGYLLPLCIVGVTYGISTGLGHDGYGRGEYCWLRSPDYIWSFAGPVLLIILTNAFFVIMALKSAKSGLKQATAARRQNLLSLRGCMSLTSILGLGWFLGYLYVVHTPAFAYMFTLLNASQGIWIFLFHVFLNDTVSTALKRYLERKRTIGEWSNSKSVNQSATNKILDFLENPVFSRKRRKTNPDINFHSTSKEFTSKAFGRVDSASTSSTRVNNSSANSTAERRAAVNPAFIMERQSLTSELAIQQALVHPPSAPPITPVFLTETDVARRITVESLPPDGGIAFSANGFRHVDLDMAYEPVYQQHSRDRISRRNP